MQCRPRCTPIATWSGGQPHCGTMSGALSSRQSAQCAFATRPAAFVAPKRESQRQGQGESAKVRPDARTKQLFALVKKCCFAAELS